PRAMGIAAAVLTGFALVPGLPSFPFLVLASVAGIVAFASNRSQLQDTAKEEAAEEEGKETPAEKIEDYLHVDPLEVRLGYGLIPLVDPAQGGDFLDRVTMIRKQTANDLGIVVPPVRIRDDITYSPNEYTVNIRGVRVAGGEIHPRSLLVIDPGYAEGEIEGIDTTEPAFGLPAKWIAANQRERAEMLGYNVVDPPVVLATLLTEVIKSHAHEILTRQDARSLIDQLKENSPTVVEELIPDQMRVGGVQKVLQNLLKERVPIRDLQTILETLSDYASVTKDTDILTEYVRTSLGRTICQLYQNEEGNIPVLTLSPEFEQQISESIQSTAGGIKVMLAPEATNQLFERLSESIDTMVSNGQQPVVLMAPNIRLGLRRLTEATFPSLTVLSYNEIVPGVEVFSVGMVSQNEVYAN
ncbi:MAG: flagellar biosynthesis protein FlhA, partial [bacterium]|nr:flagellar biosynthesis protein FlhA [bacterium]